MLSKYLKWKKARKLKAQIADYNNGFVWVFTAYFVEQMSLTEIESYTADNFDATSFDHGACEGIQLIKEFKTYVPRNKLERFRMF